MGDKGRDPEALEREIERTRLELARTIDELADRVNPRNVAHRGAERLKEEAGNVARVLGARARTEDGDGEPGQLDKRVVLAGVGVAVTLTALVLWRRSRRR
ncbi:DUF3618 domain-containing protein [Spirillospora albida]|uniref:DUF3618 domain-containing protein n=1 Tax=Spirillospora albida TaxID=58123 RepID=UPI0004C0BC32|nr:DUF3618 domain-containing protein [Spirillospora albida]